MHQKDEEIARMVQEGNTEAFGLLVERYEKKITRYAKRFLFGREDVQDLVQEIFIKAYINIKGFNTSRRFSPWIYRIAHNEFINALRRRKFEPLSFFDPDTIFPHPVADTTADGESERREVKEALEKCIGEIDEKYREPLVLYYFEDMNYKDISDVLNIPVSTVGVRINRGKKMIKKMCEDLEISYE